MQIEIAEEPGLLDTSRANDFDGSFLKVAEFESEHQVGPNSQKDSEDDEQYEYVHDLRNSSVMHRRDDVNFNSNIRQLIDKSLHGDSPTKNSKNSMLIDDQQSNLRSFRMQSILEHKNNALEKSNQKNTTQMS